MGLLSRGQAMVNRALGDTEGVTVTYSRRLSSGTTHTVTITRARHGRTLFAGLSEQAVAVQWGERDYLIEVADLVLNGSATTPQRGDRITEGSDVWELASPQTEEACWRYSDQGRTAFRCHVKRVS